MLLDLAPELRHTLVLHRLREHDRRLPGAVLVQVRIDRTSFSIVFAAGWSFLLIAITSGISMIPAFRAWIEFTRARHQHEHDGAGDPDHLDLALAGPHRLDEDDVLPSGVEDQHGLERRLRETAEVTARSHGADEDARVEEALREPDPISQERTLGEGARRIDRNDPDRSIRIAPTRRTRDAIRLDWPTPGGPVTPTT